MYTYRWAILLFVAGLCVACTTRPTSSDIATTNPVTRAAVTLSSVASATITASPVPSQTLTSTITPSPSPTPTPPAWIYVAPGISQATLLASDPETGADVAVLVLRLDPSLLTFQMFYDAEEPRPIGEWLAVTDATLVFNGGFFTGDNRPVGQLVIDGELYGSPISLDNRAGTSGLFAVVNDQADVYALGLSSYAPRGMRFEEAVEGYPMLLLPGQQAIYPRRSGRRARRTVIGMDEDGHVILLIINSPIFTLYELSQWLAISNLRLTQALNLDGGRSSGMAINTPNTYMTIPSYISLPIVVAVYVRES